MIEVESGKLYLAWKRGSKKKGTENLSRPMSRTRCLVALYFPFTTLERSSPTFAIREPGQGLTPIQVPSSIRISRPGLENVNVAKRITNDES